MKNYLVIIYDLYEGKFRTKKVKASDKKSALEQVDIVKSWHSIDWTWTYARIVEHIRDGDWDVTIVEI